MKNRKLKAAILKIHEILGLITGLVVFVVALTGALWAFQDEIQSMYVPDPIVDVRNLPVLEPSRARDLAQTVFPDKHIHGTLYREPGRSVKVIFYESDPEFYRSVFLHPYTGQVLHTEDHYAGFFPFVLEGHLTLWLPEDIGTEIVSISVLTFLFILGTGLALWWPRKGHAKERVTFSWTETTRWRRKNFDLHSIAGFYVFSLAFILAFTGCVMAFSWFKTGVYQAAGGDRATDFVVPNGVTEDLSGIDATDLPMDRLIEVLRDRNPDARSFEIHYPETDSSSIYVEITRQDGVYYSSDYRFYDQATLQEVETPSVYGRYSDAGFAEKAIRMNYDIHVGAIGGLPGKIIAFLASLTTATLPVTGFLLWYGRRKKGSKKSERVPAYQELGSLQRRALQAVRPSELRD